VLHVKSRTKRIIPLFLNSYHSQISRTVNYQRNILMYIFVPLAENSSIPTILASNTLFGFVE